MSRNMKSGVRSSSASSAAAPSSTLAMTSSSGHIFASLALSCASRIGSSSARMAVGIGRFYRGRARARAADEPGDPEREQDHGCEDRKEPHEDREDHEDE